MPHNPLAVTVVADKVRKILIRQLATGGWNATTLAARMQERGHTGWNANVVNAATKTRMFTVDEIVGLLAIFRASAKILLSEVDKVEQEIIRQVEAR